MKTIGLIGGMSWVSTVEYYRMINQEVNRRLGRHNSAKIILNSVNFDEIERNMSKERWDKTAAILNSAAARLMSSGADCILLCTNTLHMNAKDVKRSVSIPFLHIADAVSAEVKDAGYKKALLLGTKFTMEENFMKDVYIHNGIEITIPGKDEREFIQRVIFDELVKGIVREESRDMMLQMLDTQSEEGAQCAILGCTELGLILKDDDSPITLFDTTACHCKAAVDFALSK
ncbi:MAG: aspartate racemase [Denitrovibrio sp.]|nr:MAG: aspartate racemase [Denitrovibrio sp.]